MMVYWLVIAVGFPMFLLVTDKVIGYVTLSDWEIQHLAPGIPWWQASLRDLAILSLINIPSTVLVAIASWKITKENIERSFWNVFATATLTVIPPLSGIIMVVAFLYFVAAVLWIWTILMAPAYFLLGLLIIGAYVCALAVWSWACVGYGRLQTNS